MKTYYPLFSILFIAIMMVMPSLEAKDRVLGTTYNVEFYTINRYDHTGHKYGVDIYAKNHNNVYMKVTINMTHGTNVTQNLLPGRFMLAPQQVLYLGSITQVNQSQPFNWYVQWTVSY